MRLLALLIIGRKRWDGKENDSTQKGVREIQKEKLIERAEKLEEQAQVSLPIMGYPRGDQKKMAMTATIIIKAICDVDELTICTAKNALKMAADIIDEATKYDSIQ